MLNTAGTINTPRNMGSNRVCYIHGLPNELLSRIFHYYVDLCDFVFNDLESISYRACVVLCSINYRMRMLAITMSKLWTYIRLGSTPNYPPIPLIELCIERFGTAASIRVDCYHRAMAAMAKGDPTEAFNEQHTIDTINLLRPHLHRWKSFKIFLTCGSVNAFAELPLENARSLEIIDVHSVCNRDLNFKVLTNIANVRAPRYLRLFEYKFIGYIPLPRYSSLISSFPWNHLQQVHLNLTLSPSMAFQMFSALTSASVIKLCLHGVPLSAPTKSSPHGIIHLPKLRVLTIHAGIEMHSVIQRLEIPGIKELAVSWALTRNGPGIPIAEYTDFIIRKSESLNTGVSDLRGFGTADVVKLFSHPELLCISFARFLIPDCSASMIETVTNVLESIKKKKRGPAPYLMVRVSTTVFGWPTSKWLNGIVNS